MKPHLKLFNILYSYVHVLYGYPTKDLSSHCSGGNVVTTPFLKWKVPSVLTQTTLSEGRACAGGREGCSMDTPMLTYAPSGRLHAQTEKMAQAEINQITQIMAERMTQKT